MMDKIAKFKWDHTAHFWTGFSVALLVLLGITIYAHNKQAGPRKDGKPDILIDWKKLKPLIPSIIADQSDIFHESQKDMDAAIDSRIAAIFKPVYGQIPRLANFHYSVKGEYTEIVATLSGNLAKDLKKILFDDIQFKEKLQDAGAKITNDSQNILRSALNTFRTNIKNKLKLNETKMSLLANELNFSVEDVEMRLNMPVSAVQRGALAATGEVVGVAAKGVSMLAKKVATKTASKVAAKVGAKFVVGSGAVTGAAACSWAGPVGWVVCGLGGAAVAWVIVDAVVITVDEHFNREEFENDVRSMIDQQKNDVKKAFKTRYAAFINRIEESNVDRLRRLPEGKTPAEMFGTSK